MSRVLKKAFSLIELMIVIVIIGVIYTLAVTKLRSYGEESAQLSLANLKEYLGNFAKSAKSAKLLCLDDCSKCAVYVDGVKTQEIEGMFDSQPTLYRYDFIQGAVKKKEDVFFNEDNVQESVCFAYEVDRNLISDQMIVVYKDKAYDFTTYFTKTEVYNSLQELIEKIHKNTQEVLR